MWHRAVGSARPGELGTRALWGQAVNLPWRPLLQQPQLPSKRPHPFSSGCLYFLSEIGTRSRGGRGVRGENIWDSCWGERKRVEKRVWSLVSRKACWGSGHNGEGVGQHGACSFLPMLSCWAQNWRKQRLAFSEVWCLPSGQHCGNRFPFLFWGVGGTFLWGLRVADSEVGVQALMYIQTPRTFSLEPR